MNRLFPSLALLLLLGLACPAPAAPGDSPSMNPNVSSDGAKKDPLNLNPFSKERPKDAKTEITAKKEATFDNNANVAKFEGSVVVKDPQFTLFCDSLVITLNKDRKGLEKVEAVGNVIIKQENADESGKVTTSVGRAGKAIYTPSTGDVTLSEGPSIQHGINWQVGEKDTVMILNRAGTSKTYGPSKSTIVDTGDQKY